MVRLTPRQREVLNAMCLGDGSDEDIALRLRISRNTVRSHLQQIRARLNRRTRVELVVWWLLVGRFQR
jgi:DNA-binding CsgD family transcriptional regulator